MAISGSYGAFVSTLLSGSVSVISEAIHSFIDLAAAVMTFFSIGIAQRPADPGHSYGHEKVENISGVLQAVLIFVAAGLIIFESVKKLITNEPILHIEFGVAVMLLSGIINVVVARKLYKVAEEEQSVALEADALVRRGIPEHIRSGNGSEFTADAVRKLLADLGVRTLFIEPGSPWEHGYVESFNGKMRDELLNRELFDTLWEAKTLCGRWVRQYNTVRPHSALGYRPPAPEAQMPPALGELIFVT